MTFISTSWILSSCDDEMFWVSSLRQLCTLLTVRLLHVGLCLVVTDYACPMQTLQREGPGVLEHTLTKFLCHYFGEEHPSSDLLKRIELHE